MRRWFKRLAIAGVGAAAAALAASAVVWFAIDWDEDGSENYPGGVILRDSAGGILRVSLGKDDTDCRPYYRASPDDWIVKALVASEDGTYWEHCGVRPLSVLRAAFQNVVSRRRISGASTISMQAVRLIDPHPKTLVWKAIEAIKAMKMERKKDKLWILSQYLNRAPFGANFVGIEAAAQGWFGRSAKDLGIGEAACLAGMVQAPSRFRPDRHMQSALRRRDYVLGRMEELGFIDADQRKAAAAVVPGLCRAPRPFRCPFYCDWYLGEESGTALSGDIATPLDADIQGFCETAVNEAAREGGYSSAAVVMRVGDGAVVALACSGDYFAADGGQVNTALAARPAGSVLKPFLAALAFDRGLATPEMRLADVPRTYRGYRPANFDGKYRGSVSVRDALILSLNLPFVELISRTGVGEFAALLRSLGFAHLTGDDDGYGLGLAIGNAEVTLMELVKAYGELARGHGGAISAGAGYLVSDILSGGERSQASLGHIVDVEVPRLAWKTGTSAAYRDAWTVAWNPEYVIGVWCGHKSGGFGDTKLVGAKASAPVCWRIARSLYPRNAGPWFEAPQEVQSCEVCSRSGLPPGPGCTATETGHALAGRTPSIRCRGHRDGERLRIVSPEDGSVFRLVPGMKQQGIACRAAGAAQEVRLWWFVDGISRGTTAGGGSFSVEMSAGNHEIRCATEEGETAVVGISVK